MTKKKVTFSIDSKVYKGFQKYCDNNALILSKKIELVMREILKNGGFKWSLLFIMAIFLFSNVSAVTIFSDDFEDGNLNGWQLISSGRANNWTVSQVNPYEGLSHAQSNPSSTSEPASVIERNISTIGYATIVFNYHRRLIGLDTADEFKVKYKTSNTSFVVLEETLGNSADDASYVSKSFGLTANNDLNITIRFECTAGAVSEFCRMDNVSIMGDIITSDTTAPLLTINSPQNLTLNTPTPNLNVTVIEPNINGILISLDDKPNITYSHKNGTIDFGKLDLIFADDFQNYQNNSNGTPIWTNPSGFGTANVVDGVYKLFNETPIDDALSYITNFNATDYHGSAKVMVPVNSFGGAYLTPRFNDVNNKYEIVLDYDFSSININKVVNGTWTNLGALWTGDLPAPVYVSKGEWHTLGFSVIGTNISAYVDGQLALSVLDNSLNYSGFAVIAFDDTNTHTAYFDDIEIHKSLAYGSHSLVVYANDTLGNANSTSVDFFVGVGQILDTTLPSVRMVYPQNTTYNFIQTELNYTASDETALSSCWYSLNLGLTNASVVCGQNVTGLNSGQGNSTWKIWANDTSNNVNSSTITFDVDGISPVVSIVEPQNLSYNTNSLEINYSASDANLDSCWRSDNEGLTNASVVCGQNVTYTASQGSSTIFVYASDILGNIGRANVTFFVDSVYPEITITSPLNVTYNYSNINLNYTFVELNPDSCWYSLNLGLTNASVVCGQNVTPIASEGSNTWMIWINDSVGNKNSLAVTFSVNLSGSIGVSPNVSILYPSHSSTYNFTAIALNFSVVSDNLHSCWYTTDNGNINTSILNCVNTTFSVSGDGIYNLSVYANETISGEIGRDDLVFYVNSGKATIHLLSPKNNNYTNLSNVNFAYIPTSDSLINCSLYGDFNGSYLLNQTDGVTSGIENTFSLNLAEGNYIWAIGCVDSQGEVISGNRSLISDFTPPNVTIDVGSDFTTGDISLNYTVNDSSPTTCTYNITVTSTGEAVVVNNTGVRCDNVVIVVNANIPNSGTYNLNVDAGDAAGNIGHSTSTFGVTSSSGGSGNSGGNSGGSGGGSSGGSSVPAIEGIGELTLSSIPELRLKKGESDLVTVNVLNSGQRFLNSCKLSSFGAISNWISSEQVESLSSGQRTEFVFALNVPKNTKAGQYSSNIIVECNEVSGITSLSLIVMPSDFDFVFLSAIREGTELNVRYSLEDFSGSNQDVEVSYELVNPNGINVGKGSEIITLSDGVKEEHELNILLPKNSVGEFDLILIGSNGKESIKLEQSVLLSERGITGFAISGDNLRIISFLGLIIIALALLFFVLRFVQRHYARTASKSKEIIRLRMK
ncbi:hypothetical protein AUJ84_02370 [Candidatus Pacearchaeota archaeon CG1_02_32_132]|nr:MAG: hypothetical protein AUJ84_02370 [Candidatus Pacearchaeota archaeon CG1_02_32_132]